MNAQAILDASKIYTLSVYFLILFSGLIGNLCLIIVFRTLKLFRHTHFPFYLITAAIADIFLLIIVLPLRIVEYVFSYDVLRLSLAWCKIRQTIVPIFSLMSFSAICFVSIDQYFSTHYSPRLRQLSSQKLAHYLIYIACIVWTLHGIPFLIFFEIQPTTGCGIVNVGFSHYYSFVHFCVLSGILPITVSGISAALAYVNVRRIIRHQVVVVRRRLDRQLTAMVLMKVAFLVCTTSPFVLFRIYILNRTIDSNNKLQIAIEQMASTITSSLFYLNSAVCLLFKYKSI